MSFQADREVILSNITRIRAALELLEGEGLTDDTESDAAFEHWHDVSLAANVLTAIARRNAFRIGGGWAGVGRRAAEAAEAAEAGR